MGEFKAAGFHGAVGSTNATNVTTHECEYNLKNCHLGGKSSHTSRTYNATVNHRRRLLFSTRGGPARWNDKTLVGFNKFVSGICNGEILEDVEFELFETNINGDVI